MPCAGTDASRTDQFRIEQEERQGRVPKLARQIDLHLFPLFLFNVTAKSVYLLQINFRAQQRGARFGSAYAGQKL